MARTSPSTYDANAAWDPHPEAATAMCARSSSRRASSRSPPYAAASAADASHAPDGHRPPLAGPDPVLLRRDEVTPEVRDRAERHVGAVHLDGVGLGPGDRQGLMGQRRGAVQVAQEPRSLGGAAEDSRAVRMVVECRIHRELQCPCPQLTDVAPGGRLGQVDRDADADVVPAVDPCRVAGGAQIAQLGP